jgi:hypothetical protein
MFLAKKKQRKEKKACNVQAFTGTVISQLRQLLQALEHNTSS